nr:transglycosylase SLT domain-containing protein [Bradyrhizobium sp. 6(2017)]
MELSRLAGSSGHWKSFGSNVVRVSDPPRGRGAAPRRIRDRLHRTQPLRLPPHQIPHRLTISVSTLPATRPAARKRRVGQHWTKAIRLARGWHGARRIWAKLGAMPTAIRVAIVGATIVALLPLANLVFQVVRKPTELFFLVGTALDKEPTETWRQYGAHFRTYSTDTVTPELLAALAQTESSGNPVARTYWRWRLSWNPLAIYKPASSAVGLYQMIDATFAEANSYCIRQHAVVATDCWFNSLYVRTLPSHATELTAVSLDRGVARVLAAAPKSTANPQQKQDLAALIHLCGTGPGPAFVRRGFQPAAGEHCGDHLVAAYLAKVNRMRRQFAKLAANDRG